MKHTLSKTNYQFPNQTKFYKGKVRDVYHFKDGTLAMIASDRLSAFDVILPKPITHKGEILNKIAAEMLRATADIAPNWLIATPDANVSIGKECTPFKVEMVIRGYLTGHAWREYHSGKRTLCGVNLPEGMRENEQFKTPIITPATKAMMGAHDEDISKKEIIKQGIVSAEDYAVIEKYTYALFKRGSEIAKKRGLILVDTKYEFGKDKDGTILVIDEIHTPDSSRYFYADSYKELFEKGEQPMQLSKEFVRHWLIENNFQGKKGQQLPEITDEKVDEISKRYQLLYEKITGEKFVPSTAENILNRVKNNILDYLKYGK